MHAVVVEQVEFYSLAPPGRGLAPLETVHLLLQVLPTAYSLHRLVLEEVHRTDDVPEFLPVFAALRGRLLLRLVHQGVEFVGQSPPRKDLLLRLERRYVLLRLHLF